MNEEFMQSPIAKLVDTGNNDCVLVLEDWNVEDIQSGYTRDEVKSLIDMLQQSLDIMDRYHSANQDLPLFEGVENDVQQQTTTQSF